MRRGWEDFDFRLVGSSLLLIPAGHRLNRFSRPGGRSTRGRAQRPRGRRTKRTSSSRGDPDPGEPGEQPPLPVTRKGSTMKRGGAL